MKKTVISLLLAAAWLPAISAEGRWIEGFGQGNLEYFIDKQGFRLSIGCPTKDGSFDSPSSISLKKLKDDSDVGKFTITVNGNSYDAPFETSSRVDDNNFLSLIEDLRKGDAIVKFGKTSINFPKSNSKNIIPKYQSKDFSCNLFF